MQTHDLGYRLVCAGMVTAALFGCARQNMNNVGLAASQPAASQPAPTPAAPYQLTAQCSGPMVRFRLQNLSDSELQVQNKDFALVVPGQDRKVIPYNAENVSVDLPASVVPPHQTVEGRAVFNDNNMPNGCRLVFKPYSRPSDPGTFAEIIAPANS
jgi:hypothetical protein